MNAQKHDDRCGLWTFRVLRWLLPCVLGGLMGCAKAPERAVRSPLDVDASPAPATFELEGKPLCFAGANNYYVAFKPKPMVDDVFAAARSLGFPVLRIWGFLEAGALDGSVRHVDPWGDSAGRKDGVYFQYWDPVRAEPAFNDGADGLQKLDYALARAAETGVKILLVLTNNWRDFGGMDQYLAWYGLEEHYRFYTEPRVKQAFKNWINHLVNRKNTVNGRLYRDDPTLFAWELGNEPRCRGSEGSSSGWSNQTIVGWAEEMSAFIHSLDPNHLVSVGDEGFLAQGGEHWTYRGKDGVDHEALSALPGIDFATYHAYPEHWGAELSWAERWIVDHERVARRLGKPTVLEEYGVKVKRNSRFEVESGLAERLESYRSWNELSLREGGNATLVWMLGGLDTLDPAPGGVYHDYDSYTLYRGDPSTALLSAFARRFAGEARACRMAAKEQAGAASSYVRVRKPQRADAGALAWGMAE